MEARSSQEQPGAARSSQEQPGAARSSQEQPGTLQMLSNLIYKKQKCQILKRKLRVVILWKFAGAPRSSQEQPGGILEETSERYLEKIWEPFGGARLRRHLGSKWRSDLIFRHSLRNGMPKLL